MTSLVDGLEERGIVARQGPVRPTAGPRTSPSPRRASGRGTSCCGGCTSRLRSSTPSPRPSNGPAGALLARLLAASGERHHLVPGSTRREANRGPGPSPAIGQISEHLPHQWCELKPVPGETGGHHQRTPPVDDEVLTGRRRVQASRLDWR